MVGTNVEACSDSSYFTLIKHNIMGESRTINHPEVYPNERDPKMPEKIYRIADTTLPLLIFYLLKPVQGRLRL